MPTQQAENFPPLRLLHPLEGINRTIDDLGILFLAAAWVEFIDRLAIMIGSAGGSIGLSHDSTISVVMAVNPIRT